VTTWVLCCEVSSESRFDEDRFWLLLDQSSLLRSSRRRSTYVASNQAMVSLLKACHSGLDKGRRWSIHTIHVKLPTAAVHPNH
jgi:hypothetical protein